MIYLSIMYGKGQVGIGVNVMPSGFASVRIAGKSFILNVLIHKHARKLVVRLNRASSPNHGRNNEAGKEVAMGFCHDR